MALKTVLLDQKPLEISPTHWHLSHIRLNTVYSSIPIYSVKMTQKQKALSAEEELLLQDFSRNVSTKSNALFYGNAFIVSAIPICKYLTHWKIFLTHVFYLLWIAIWTSHCVFKGLFWRIHFMDLLTSSPLFVIMTLVSTYLVSFAYKNTKFILKHKVKITFS